MAQQAPFAPTVLRDAERWGKFIGDEWIRSFPTTIHDRQLGPDGRPRWHGDFHRWMTSSQESDDSRYRVTRVMRRLRKAAPREYECAYRVLVLGESFEDLTRWLNERALRNNIPLPTGRPKHYRLKDAVALFIAAVEYAKYYL